MKILRPATDTIRASRVSGIAVEVLDAAVDLASKIAAIGDPNGAEAEAPRAEIARLRALPTA